MAFLKLVGEELGEAKSNAELKPLAEALEQGLDDLQASTMWTGMRMVRPLSAMARVMTWRIHQVAYVENL